MGAINDILVNIFDAVAFSLAGAEIFGKEQLRKAVERLCTWTDKIIEREKVAQGFGSYVFRLFFVTSILIILATVASLFLISRRTSTIIVFYLILAAFVTVFVMVTLIFLAMSYKRMMELYDQPLALLKLGAVVFMVARLMAIFSAWDELPSVAEFMHLDAPAIRLGAEFQEWKLERERRFRLSHQRDKMIFNSWDSAVVNAPK